MNMKKLIEEADFDNVQQISKRWKKDIKNSPAQNESDLAELLNQGKAQKENVPDLNIIKSHPAEKDTSYSNMEISTLSTQNNNRKRQVMPQVIDEDTEHFKNKLEHLLNTFKTDAIGQFMGMKKAMLEYQKETIKGDTQKYLQMYEEKHQQLISTKQSLIETSKQLQKKTIQVELMSSHISKLNERIKTVKYLSRPFSVLYENKLEEKMLKIKYVQAERSDNRRMLVKALGGWRNIWRQIKQQKQHESTEKRINDEVKDIVNRLNKEMQMLKEQLSQAVRKNQQYQNNKVAIQQNLKKAFLRGMCAMNMEAMGVLGTEPETLSQPVSNSMLQNNTSIMQMINTSQLTENHHHQSSKNLGNSHFIPMTTEKDSNLPNAINSSVYMGKIKTESKQHKWKQAPIMGIEHSDQCEEPRPILVKPSTQGKVIKIIDGKSSTVDPKKPLAVSNAKQTSASNMKETMKETINNKSSILSSRKY